VPGVEVVEQIRDSARQFLRHADVEPLRGLDAEGNEGEIGRRVDLKEPDGVGVLFEFYDERAGRQNLLTVIFRQPDGAFAAYRLYEHAKIDVFSIEAGRIRRGQPIAKAEADTVLARLYDLAELEHQRGRI